MTTSDFVGRELEQAYANVFGGRVVGGLNDHGLDVITNDSLVPAVQVKSSIPMACKFLAESQKRKQFIPICIGEPGERNAILMSLKKFGAWIENGIPGREKALVAISNLRNQLSPSL